MSDEQFQISSLFTKIKVATVILLILINVIPVVFSTIYDFRLMANGLVIISFLFIRYYLLKMYNAVK